MSQSISPLRYPGGKAILSDLLAGVVRENQLSDAAYVEPYAGGAGAALNLLFGEHVQSILLNDIDRSIYLFWYSVLHKTTEFTKMIKGVRVSMSEWNRCREIYQSPKHTSQVKQAFAAFYLNRCNRSGIIMNGGPIGGKGQKGKWKLNDRFNKHDLIQRIARISLFKTRIGVCNEDALALLKRLCKKCDPQNTLIYLDPPYYVKGSKLYLNSYSKEDHKALASFLLKHQSFKWVLSYDNVKEVRALYCGIQNIQYKLNYSASSVRKGKEILFFSNSIKLPEYPHRFLPGRVCVFDMVPRDRATPGEIVARPLVEDTVLPGRQRGCIPVLDVCDPVSAGHHRGVTSGSLHEGEEMKRCENDGGPKCKRTISFRVCRGLNPNSMDARACRVFTGCVGASTWIMRRRGASYHVVQVKDGKCKRCEHYLHINWAEDME